MKRIKSFLTTTDLTVSEIYWIFRKAGALKKRPYVNTLKQKSLAMIFQKPSTRTRVSFEVGMTQLGGHALYLGSNDLQLSRGETIADTAKVLGRYVDVIMARVFSHNDVEELARHASVPVINGLSDRFHPCQSLADIFTLWEKRKKLTGLRMSFIGDGDNNVTNSLCILAAQLGIHFTIGSPRKYQMTDEIFSLAKTIAQKSGSEITRTEDPVSAIGDSDVVVTDVWVSMGREDRNQRIQALKPYQLNSTLLAKAKSTAYVLHCLPAHRGEEITNDVIDGSQSLVWDEAENRLHTQKALLLFLLGKSS